MRTKPFPIRLKVSNITYNKSDFFMALSKNKKNKYDLSAFFNIGNEFFIIDFLNSIKNSFKNIFKSKEAFVISKNSDIKVKELYKKYGSFITLFKNTPFEVLDDLLVPVHVGLQLDLYNSTELLKDLYVSKTYGFDKILNMINETDTFVCNLTSNRDFILSKNPITLNSHNFFDIYYKQQYEILSKVINPNSVIEQCILSNVIPKYDYCDPLFKNITELSFVLNEKNNKELQEKVDMLSNNLESLLLSIKHNEVNIQKHHMDALKYYLDKLKHIITFIGMHYSIYNSFIHTLLEMYKILQYQNNK